MAVHFKRFGDQPRGCMSTAQVTRIHNTNLFVTKSIDEFIELCATARVQFWIGVSAKGAGHVSLCMANEKKIAHIVHTPQK